MYGGVTTIKHAELKYDVEQLETGFPFLGSGMVCKDLDESLLFFDGSAVFDAPSKDVCDLLAMVLNEGNVVEDL